MKVSIILGTRPELIKMQPIIEEIKKRESFECMFTHTGQHYDLGMSDVFIRELELPEPDTFLNVRSGSQGYQTARIIARCERVLRRERPEIVLVEGDTNSALGASIAASKLKIRIGHVEAGCRSFDKNMPEEINRVLIADLASINFAPTQTCVKNLLNEGIPQKQVYLTGHPIVDLLHKMHDKIREATLRKFQLRQQSYYLVTLHREENINDKAQLRNVLNGLSVLAKETPIIFPMHPHTSKLVKRFRMESQTRNMTVIEPVSYFESLSLIKYARMVLTDSGGIQQEAAILKVPCITLRATTEWIETVKCGINFLASSKEEIIAMTKLVEKRHENIVNRFRLTRGIFGEPPISTKIIDILEGCS